ncbi:hypothetical protein SAMN05216456_1590 [Devosia crocina]|uniref:Uncharacterized protein n=1 Tax=Devosia crocina TaxID=429728 RepID=A0A1I7NC56_9HYPH|nr:hypothetical protein [Devosia crocina]SFV32264.1 hypothetical protein SAMN05216456_1590 [Devosia crocina]
MTKSDAYQLSPEEFVEERDRIRDIIADGRQAGFPQLAEVLAFESDLSADQAKAAFMLARDDQSRPQQPPSAA